MHRSSWKREMSRFDGFNPSLPGGFDDIAVAAYQRVSLLKGRNWRRKFMKPWICMEISAS